MARRPFGLIVCDGFGCRAEREANAVALAHTPVFDRLRRVYPQTQILSHGESVGLLPGLMGNSEVGHMNIGAGRIVVQSIDRINNAIGDGSLAAHPELVALIDRTRETGKRLHLLALLSDGGVHSHEDHVHAAIRIAAARGLSGDRVVVHAFTDGRDTAPRCASSYFERLDRVFAETRTGVLGTVIGRYWAMDRDNRWERVKRAYDAMVRGVGFTAASGVGAVASAYARDEGDEFIAPTLIEGGFTLARGDGVFFVNFRPDRARQLSIALHGLGGFAEWPIEALELSQVTMTEYRADFPFPVLFKPISLREVYGEMMESAGMRQLRIAETEKYAHVTFFLNGGREEAFRGEERILVPSPKVATYDLAPEMSAAEVTAKTVDAIRSGRLDTFVVNFANPDMVGHTGVLPAAIRAVEVVDAGIGAIVDAVLERGGSLVVTADHGNCEMMVDPVTGQPHTSHTTNPVPFHLVSDAHRGRVLRPDGRLCDVIPTLLATAGLAPSPLMTGRSLLDV